MDNKTKKVITFVITLFFGYLGVHKFMEKKIGMGVLYLFTCGLFGIGWMIDVIKSFIAIFSNDDNNVSFSSSDVQYTKLRGVTKDCLYVEGLNRQTALENLPAATSIHIEQAPGTGTPILLVVTSDGIDIGEISYERASEIFSNNKTVVDIFIKEITGGYDGKNYGCNITYKLV